ncbi:MAG: tRNA (cytidine(34)-2'-O)-methyltransferase [Anaerolineae bacterium]|nr:tRNA (cytidine(34)-2'-O)-methyltransferase [Phycisphaerae bacterium]
MNLAPHDLKLAIMQPQIAPNTGNIARLCVATGTPLHLVRPMGFVLSDRQLKRSAMDYWPRLKLTVHDDTDAFLRSIGNTPCWFFDSTGEVDLWSVDFHNGDCLTFGSETSGVPESILRSHPDRVVRIPQVENERCLNLATAAGIALYESLRRAQQMG